MYIAVSRMIDGVIGIPYVNGSASTTPITSVRPGSTATSMPTTSPTASDAALTGDRSSRKPRKSWYATSCIAPSADAERGEHRDGKVLERPAAERKRHVDDLHEHVDEHEAPDD